MLHQMKQKIYLQFERIARREHLNLLLYLILAIIAKTVTVRMKDRPEEANEKEYQRKATNIVWKMKVDHG